MTITNKIISYICVALVATMIVISFITASNYTQLAIASLLYPPLIYFAFKFIGRKSENPNPEKFVVAVEQDNGAERKAVDIVDIDKRAFLKLVGAAGFSFFLFSLFTKKVESLLLGRSVNQGATLLDSGPSNQNSSLKPTDSYKISEIDNYGEVSFYGFVDKYGGWYIMKEDTMSGSFRYTKGDSNFPISWKNRQTLSYDYFHNIFH